MSSQQSISLLLLVFIQFSSLMDNAFRPRQRHFRIYRLKDSSLLSLCRLGDEDRFKSLLKPILVPRVVDTTEHRQVGLVTRMDFAFSYLVNHYCAATHTCLCCKIKKFMKNVLDSVGFHTEWDHFLNKTPHGEKMFYNLIATQDKNAHRQLVLACHYDSKVLKDGVFIGATDSAVPCAMLLDIAVSLGPLLKHRLNKNVSLQLIFLDGEEAFEEWTDKDSLYGARHLSAKLRAQKFVQSSGSSFAIDREINKIDVFVLLDLLGASNPVISNTLGHHTDKLFAEFPKIEAKLRSLNCLYSGRTIFTDPNYALQISIDDDHKPFLDLGVPIIHLIPSRFPIFWHTLGDNASILHYPTIYNLLTIVRVFTAKYLGVT